MAGWLLLLYVTVLLGLASSSDLEPLESILCPHDDPQTNTCYDMTSENRTCIVITFSSCDDSGSNSPWHQHRHWWTESICWNIQQDNCTVYKCQKTCCDGWTTDLDGRCEKPIYDDDIRCENGEVNWVGDSRQCECWQGFYGERCEKPRCDGGCKNGGTCLQKTDGRHQCHCPSPFTGQNCESVTCIEPCLNGGTCVSNGAEAVCACPLNFYGKTCKHKIDGTLCPMPNNTDCRHKHCRDQCLTTAGCRDGYVCCSDGCRMKCVRPVTKTCSHGDRFYKAGEIFAKDNCNYCTCHMNGSIVCDEIKCPKLECERGELSYQDDLCCPVCRGNNILPVDYTRPTLSRCYNNVVVPLNVSRHSNTFYLANLHLDAWDYEGTKLQVKYNPPYLDHCHCDKSERTTRVISAFAVDRFGGRIECNFHAYVLDPIPPSFLSCPADIYALDDEDISWDEPRAQDNVGIQYLWSSMDQDDIINIGEYTVTYTAIDYDYNQATCEFNVFVYDHDMDGSNMPQGLSCRKKRTHTAGIVVGTICGGVAVFVLILVAILAQRIRRRHTRRPAARSVPAVSNAQYDLFPDYKGSSTKPPGYSPPSNPPAYDELNNPDGKDYKFANPPLYDELSLAGDKKDGVAGDATEANMGIYEPAGVMEGTADAVANPTYGSAQGSIQIRTPNQTDV